MCVRVRARKHAVDWETNVHICPINDEDYHYYQYANGIYLFFIAQAAKQCENLSSISIGDDRIHSSSPAPPPAAASTKTEQQCITHTKAQILMSIREFFERRTFHKICTIFAILSLAHIFFSLSLNSCDEAVEA